MQFNLFFKIKTAKGNSLTLVLSSPTSKVIYFSSTDISPFKNAMALKEIVNQCIKDHETYLGSKSRCFSTRKFSEIVF